VENFRGVYLAGVRRSDDTARDIWHVRPMVTICNRFGERTRWGIDGCEGLPPFCRFATCF
jgi:hypothetical protein